MKLLEILIIGLEDSESDFNESRFWNHGSVINPNCFYHLINLNIQLLMNLQAKWVKNMTHPTNS